MLEREMGLHPLCYHTMETMVPKFMECSQESDAERKESLNLCYQQGEEIVSQEEISHSSNNSSNYL